MTYAPAKFEAAMSNGLGGNAFTRNIWFDLDPKLLRPMVKEMHYQENILFEEVKVTQIVAQYPRLHVTYAPAKFGVATSHGWEDAFTRKYIIWP